MKIKFRFSFAAVLVIPLYLTFLAFHTDIAQASDDAYDVKVPESKLAEVKALKNVVASNKKSLSEAKAIYTGKGTCFNCHGEKGRGDGELASSFNPPPRNFTYAPWQEARTDGEIFWVITNGTENGIHLFRDMLSDEEKWSLINSIRKFVTANGLANSN